MLDGMKVIVTGAGGGIGRSIASAVEAAGGKAIRWDLRAGDGVAAVDVCDRRGVEEALAMCGEGTDIPAGLVNAAGVGGYVPFLELAAETWRQVVDVNLTGSFNVLQLWARRRVDAGLHGGAAVNITSIAARVASSGNNVHYSASKGGAEAMTRAAAVALGGHGIRVNAVGPGPVPTEMNQAKMSDEATRARMTSRMLLGRLGEPDDIANAVTFLLSPLSAWTTGATLLVDGGMTALN